MSLLFWNDIALEANRKSHSINGGGEQTGPTLSSRALAIIHIAMYDAYIKAGGFGLDTYLDNHPSFPSPSPTAACDAMAGAACKTLKTLYPSQSNDFDMAINLYTSTNATFSSTAFDFGIIVATNILADRANDPSSSDAGYVTNNGYGRHRAAPDSSNNNHHAPYYGANSKPFVSNLNFRLNPFPSFTSSTYTMAWEEVKNKGIKTELQGMIDNTQRRTNDQTMMGIFWGYDGANKIGTPPRLYNQIIRELSAKVGLSETENVILFALVNTAMADAGIFAWREKYVHDIWRPVVGIRENNPSMGISANTGDNPVNNTEALWLPLGAPHSNNTGNNPTPPFPAYPSGHATFGAAAFYIAKYYFDYINKNPFTTPFDFVSDEFNGVTKDNQSVTRPRHIRQFDSFEKMVEENGLSRVYLGVHWKLDAFDCDANGNPVFSQDVDLTPNSNGDVIVGIGGVLLGKGIAEHIFKRFRYGTDGINKSNLGAIGN